MARVYDLELIISVHQCLDRAGVAYTIWFYPDKVEYIGEFMGERRSFSSAFQSEAAQQLYGWVILLKSGRVPF